MKRGQPSTRKSINGWLLLPLFLFVPAALSCGGGGNVTVAGGGIGGTGYTSVGTITAKGSIFVNGIEFETTDASVILNGAAGNESDLQVGMVVKVEGTVYNDGKTGKADRVEFERNAYGPISGIDSEESSLEVVGQTVWVEAQTVIVDESGNEIALAELEVNDTVEISGIADSEGNIKATRILWKPSAVENEVEIRGMIGYLYVDATNRLIGINYQWVDYSDATLVNFAPAGGPAYWDYVVVKGTLTTGTIPGTNPPVTASILKASRVEKVVPYYDPDYVNQFFGYVGKIEYANDAVSSFDIWTMFGPLKVQLTDATVISGKPLDELTPFIGQEVKVEGTLSGFPNYVLQATKLEIKEKK